MDKVYLNQMHQAVCILKCRCVVCVIQCGMGHKELKDTGPVMAILPDSKCFGVSGGIGCSSVSIL